MKGKSCAAIISIIINLLRYNLHDTYNEQHISKTRVFCLALAL